MPLRTLTAARVLDVPPPFDVVTLREAGDAFAHACAIAGTSGAGTLVWVGRYDLAEFAVVLEPEETLAQARRAFYVGMNALADALSFRAPPERQVAFDWPDAIRIDGALVGGGRLGWPDEASEDEVPSWLVFSGMVRTVAVHAGESGLRPLLGALDEVGFEEIESAEIVASFTRHLMAGFYDRDEAGVAVAAGNWLARLPRQNGERFSLTDKGDLLVFQGDVPEPVERRELALALATPSWLDPATGTPWL